MKTRLALLLIAAVGLTGCANSYKLPEVSGKLVDYKRTDPFGGTAIIAKGVEVTPDVVRAEEATWTTTYPQFSVSLRVVGYERKREETK